MVTSFLSRWASSRKDLERQTPPIRRHRSRVQRTRQAPMDSVAIQESQGHPEHPEHRERREHQAQKVRQEHPERRGHLVQ